MKKCDLNAISKIMKIMKIGPPNKNYLVTSTCMDQKCTTKVYGKYCRVGSPWTVLYYYGKPTVVLPAVETHYIMSRSLRLVDF